VRSSTVCGNAINCISWFNPAAFSGPKNAGGSLIADGNFGNLGKGALRDPGSIGFPGMSKNFTLHESWKLTVPPRVLQRDQPRESKQSEHQPGCRSVRQNHRRGRAESGPAGTEADVLKSSTGHSLGRQCPKVHNITYH
jgi:hypothetical protein